MAAFFGLNRWTMPPRCEIDRFDEDPRRCDSHDRGENLIDGRPPDTIIRSAPGKPAFEMTTQDLRAGARTDVAQNHLSRPARSNETRAGIRCSTARRMNRHAEEMSGLPWACACPPVTAPGQSLSGGQQRPIANRPGHRLRDAKLVDHDEPHPPTRRPGDREGCARTSRLKTCGVRR